MSPHAEATYDAVERARSESEDHSTAGSKRGQDRRDGGRLGMPELVELGVGLPLDAAYGVPLGPAVPQQDELSHAQPRSGAVTSAGSGIVGQSRQSRSSA